MNIPLMTITDNTAVNQHVYGIQSDQRSSFMDSESSESATSSPICQTLIPIESSTAQNPSPPSSVVQRKPKSDCHNEQQEPFCNPFSTDFYTDFMIFNSQFPTDDTISTPTVQNHPDIIPDALRASHNITLHSFQPGHDHSNFKTHKHQRSNASTLSTRSSNSASSKQSSVGTANSPAMEHEIAPKRTKPRIATTYWDDEKTVCYQVEAFGVLVSRREDSDYINGTKLLNVAGMTRGKRDGILKSERIREVVKVGSMNLKGVWIPFERAAEIARNEGVIDILYPLFVKNLKTFFEGRGASLKYDDVPSDFLKREKTDGDDKPV